MILLLCLDKKDGMMFGDRRQSRDSAVTERILSLAEGKRLFASPYSATLFPVSENLISCPDPAAEAGEGDFCFVENTPLPAENVEEIILFLWNRNYPATKHFDRKAFSLKRIKKEDFVGSSHEKITMERYLVAK